MNMGTSTQPAFTCSNQQKDQDNVWSLNGKVTMIIPDLRRSGAFIANFELFSLIILMFLLLILNK